MATATLANGIVDQDKDESQEISAAEQNAKSNEPVTENAAIDSAGDEANESNEKPGHKRRLERRNTKPIERFGSVVSSGQRKKPVTDQEEPHEQLYS